MSEHENPQQPATEAAGALNTALNIFTAPSEAFTELAQRPAKLFPVILISLSAALVIFWYFSMVDFEWYVEDTLSMTVGDLPEDQLEMAREGMLATRGFTLSIGVVSAALVPLMIWAALAAYLSLVSALRDERFGFGHWFSLVAWVALPGLLGIIGMAVTLALSPNGQLSAMDLNPLTLTSLGMNPDNDSARNMLGSISLPMVWSMVLLIMGYRQWLQSGWGRAVAVVVAPYLLVYGVWAFNAF